MTQTLLKSLALKAIAMNAGLPEAKLDRMGELVHLRRLLALLRINCVLDVGANRGQFSSELRAIGYQGLIVSFEPIESEFLAMKQFFAADQQWMGYQLALGSLDETRMISIPKLTVMSSLLTFIGPEKEMREESIQLRRLDGILPSLVSAFDEPRVFLKMDTQGYDLEVFKGSAGCMDWIQGIQSELSVHPLYREMPHYLTALETYETAGFDLHNLSVVNRISDGGLLELNCFMRRRKT